MKPKEYEELVRKLISELTQTVGTSCFCAITGGRKNKITGASGFAHQVDVSLKTGRALFLFECKYWGKPVDAEPVLVISSRLAHVRAANPNLEVKAAVISTKQPTAGAQILSRYFDVRLDVVATPSEYALLIRDQFYLGRTDLLSVGLVERATVVKRDLP
jgi:hypothetical protein